MYINKKETRKRILAKMAKTRPECGFTRVSENVLRQIDVRIDEMINHAVWAHSSTGKTFRDFI